MEKTQVASILRSLASGVDPTSNRAANEVFAQPDVIRALFIAAELVEEVSGANGGGAHTSEEQRAARPAAAGVRWTDDEDARLCRQFDDGLAISEIAAQHGRTRGAITSRLVKLGRLDPESVRPRERFSLTDHDTLRRPTTTDSEQR